MPNFLELDSQCSEKANERQHKQEERRRQRDEGQQVCRERLKSRRKNEQHAHQGGATSAASNKTPKQQDKVLHNDARTALQGFSGQLEAGAIPKRHGDRCRKDGPKREVSQSGSHTSVENLSGAHLSVDASAVETADVMISRVDAEDRAKQHLADKEDEAVVAQRKQGMKTDRELKARIKNKVGTYAVSVIVGI